MKINLEIQRLSLDKVGNTFQFDGKFYRAIKKEAIKDVVDLLNCGLINELSSNKLFPKTRIADIEIQGYDLVLEHEKVNHVTYPFEWSFSMLKDASLCILNVVEICAKYGYGLHDLHNYNVIFEGCHPVFIDFGSIQKNASFQSSLDSFIDYNFLPLKLFSIGEMTFAKRILSDEYLDRYVPKKNYHESLLTKSLIRELYLGNKKNIVKIFLNYFGGNYNLKFDHLSVEKVRNSILNIQKIEYPSEWGKYHLGYKNKEVIDNNFRFNRIIQLVNKIEVKEVLDIGGNQGLVTKIIKDKCSNIKEAICLDYDENAIDDFYNTSKYSKSATQLYPVHSNILFPINVNYFLSFEDRMKSDLVLALALTHHLILSQYFPIDSILKKIKELSKKYVIVEFMPLGLWGGKELPEIPEWYTIDWFREQFLKYFTIELEEKLEINRIIFVGLIE